MKKSMLCAGFMTILSATAYSEESTNQIIQLAASTQAPATTNQVPPAKASTTPTTTQTTTTETKAPATSTAPTSAATATKPQALNCSYRIPAATTHIEQTIVKKWAEKAVEQSFDFDYKTIDNQISKLKSCFTEQGWQGFNDAFEKSGNLNAIKAQQLTVSSMVNGESKVTELKENQWKVSLPLQVVYQNDKEKLTQPLTVDLLIGRKVSGDLGIMQMIAMPSQTSGAVTPKP